MTKRNNYYQKILRNNNFIENNFNENGLNNNLRNKSETIFRKNNRYKQNIQEKLYNNKNNTNNNFWNEGDTVNIKMSINLKKNYKYPEPNDIDDYLFN